VNRTKIDHPPVCLLSNLLEDEFLRSQRVAAIMLAKPSAPRFLPLNVPTGSETPKTERYLCRVTRPGDSRQIANRMVSVQRIPQRGRAGCGATVLFARDGPLISHPVRLMLVVPGSPVAAINPTLPLFRILR
jgi:hypothetical protein